MLILRRPTPALALASLALAGACSGEPTQPSPEPKAAPPTPTATEKTPPSEAAPTKATKPTEPSAIKPAPTQASPLHVVALREGPIQLMRLGTEPALVLEGESVPVVDGVPVRGASGSRGLPTLHGFGVSSTTLAISGTLEAPGSAWVTTEEARERASTWYRVHRNLGAGKGWEPVDLRSGLLVAYHAAYVERGGARLGLRAWSNDAAQDQYGYNDESARATAYWKSVEKAKAKASGGFVHLEGPETALPEVPAGMQPFAAVTTDDGTLYALAVEAPEAPADPGKEVLLVWPPSATKAERVELPGWEGERPRLDASGDVALVMGMYQAEDSVQKGYLATGRGTQWERVPVSLPGLSANASHEVMGAAQTATGELWIAVGGWGLEPTDAAVWRKPKDGGEWQPVPLPDFGDALFGRDAGFAYDLVGLEPEGWYAFERPALEPTTPREPKALAGADGHVWVVLELGPAHSAEQEQPIMRSVVLSTRVGAATPTRLPAPWELYLERHDARASQDTPGKEPCTRVAFVVGPASLLESQPALLDAVRGASTVETSIELVYVGRLDDAEVLVASTHVASPGEAKSMQRALAKAAGTEPAVECRIPAHVRAVPSP